MEHHQKQQQEQQQEQVDKGDSSSLVMVMIDGESIDQVEINSVKRSAIPFQEKVTTTIIQPSMITRGLIAIVSLSLCITISFMIASIILSKGDDQESLEWNIEGFSLDDFEHEFIKSRQVSLKNLYLSYEDLLDGNEGVEYFTRIVQVLKQSIQVFDHNVLYSFSKDNGDYFGLDEFSVDEMEYRRNIEKNEKLNEYGMRDAQLFLEYIIDGHYNYYIFQNVGEMKNFTFPINGSLKRMNGSDVITWQIALQHQEIMWLDPIGYSEDSILISLFAPFTKDGKLKAITSVEFNPQQLSKYLKESIHNSPNSFICITSALDGHMVASSELSDVLFTYNVEHPNHVKTRQLNETNHVVLKDIANHLLNTFGNQLNDLRSVRFRCMISEEVFYIKRFVIVNRNLKWNVVTILSEKDTPLYELRNTLHSLNVGAFVCLGISIIVALCLIVWIFATRNFTTNSTATTTTNK